jgi:hypothetical protein
MTAYPSGPERIRFRGSPPGADAYIPRRYQDVLATEMSARLQMPGARELTAFRVVPRAAGDAVTRLHLRLSMSTPVGTYQGTLRIGAEEHPIEVRVDGHSDLGFSPSHLTLMATPGDEETVELTVVNRGNLPVDLPDEVSLELMDGHAIPQALRALHERPREKGAQGRDPVARAADRIAQHVETLPVEIAAGSGPLPAGEMRELRLNVRYPKDLTPGRSYIAVWPLANQQFYIVAVHVRPPASTDEQVP